VTADISPDDIPAPTLEAGWEQDSTSTREEEHWGELDDLSKQQKKNELAFHRALGWCIPIAIIVAFTLFLSSILIYLIHVLAPPYWRWLSPDEIQHLHNMIFSSIVGGAVTEGVRSYMKKKPE